MGYPTQNNTCVCCGVDIPEGMMVCPKCEEKRLLSTTTEKPLYAKDIKKIINDIFWFGEEEMKPNTPVGTLYFKNGKQEPIFGYMDGLGRFELVYFITKDYTYVCRTHREGDKSICRFYRLTVGTDDSLRAEEIFNISKVELTFKLT